jgi:hypothetical protein
MPERTPWYLDGPFAHAGHRRYIGRLRARTAGLRAPAIRALVESLLSPDAPRTNYWLLALCGRRAVPALVAALEDERFHAPEALRSEGPFENVWNLLEPLAPVKAIEPLGRLLRSKSPDVRRNAALGLGSIGAVASVPLLRKALRLKDHFDRSAALTGIDRSVRDGRATRQFLAAVFRDVARVVEMPSVGGTDAPRVLLVIDRDRATEFLTDPARFRADHPEVASIVRALAQARVRLPAGRLVVLMDELVAWEKRNGRPNTTAIGYGLQLLALSGDPSARQKVERATASKDDYLRGLAADAMKILDGVPDAFHVALEAWSAARDVTQLPEPVRHYLTVQVMRNEVANGSFHQYFFNSYSGGVRHALAGLEALGAEKAAAIVREVIALFGKAGPSRDRARRQRQLDRVDGEALVRLSDAFLKDPDRLDVLLSRFAARHREHFERR